MHTCISQLYQQPVRARSGHLRALSPTIFAVSILYSLPIDATVYVHTQAHTRVDTEAGTRAGGWLRNDQVNRPRGLSPRDRHVACPCAARDRLLGFETRARASRHKREGERALAHRACEGALLAYSAPHSLLYTGRSRARDTYPSSCQPIHFSRPRSLSLSLSLACAQLFCLSFIIFKVCVCVGERWTFTFRLQFGFHKF